MDLPSLDDLRMLTGLTFSQLVALGAAVVMAVAMLGVLRSAREPENRSFRATHSGPSQAVIALGVTLGVGAALIVVAPLIASLIPA